MKKAVFVPIPVKVQWLEGSYTFPKTTNIGVDERLDGNFDFIIQTVGDCLSRYAFVKGVKSGKENADLVFEKSDRFSGEEYQITVTGDRITVFCGAPVGAFRAVCTLKQIMAQQGNCISCLDIYDKPDFAERGVQLDLSRGKIPKLQTIKQVAQMLADIKCNQLHLYFENFSFEYQGFPEYCKDTEPLTVEEIHELDKFCAERFIELIPFQNGFGHMGHWLAKDELKHLSIKKPDGSSSGTLNPLDPESFALMEKIYDSILPHFSSDKVNIGFDEAFELGMGETKEACEKYGMGKVFTDYLCKISDLITRKYHKKPFFAYDMLASHPECWNDIPKDCSVLIWGYDSWSARFDKFCSEIKPAGLDFYIHCGTSTWNSLTGRSINAIHNIRGAAESAKDHGAKGLVLTDWGDGGHPQFLPISYLSFAVFACYSWNGGESVIDSDETRSELFLHDVWKPSFIEPVIMENSKAYLDQFIFQCAEGTSLSDEIYRMGQYMYLENECLGNTTRAFEMYHVGFGKEGYNMQKGCMKNINPVFFESAAKYMRDIIADLERCQLSCEDGDLIIRELICNCRMVEMMERALVLQYYYYNNKVSDAMRQDAEALANEIYGMEEEFVSLWNARNHSVGSDAVIQCLNKTADVLHSGI